MTVREWKQGEILRELSILIADDSETIRRRLLTALTGIEGLTLVGLAEDGAEAIKMFEALRPAIIVLDISMPKRMGFDVLEEVRKYDQEAVVIMFSFDPSPALRNSCFERGANFCLHKSQIRELVIICEELLQESKSGSCQQLLAQAS
jgi:DNA-binding NarL/FixJ family response regulator